MCSIGVNSSTLAFLLRTTFFIVITCVAMLRSAPIQSDAQAMVRRQNFTFGIKFGFTCTICDLDWHHKDLHRDLLGYDTVLSGRLVPSPGNVGNHQSRALYLIPEDHNLNIFWHFFRHSILLLCICRTVREWCFEFKTRIWGKKFEGKMQIILSSGACFYFLRCNRISKASHLFRMR
jgi:hypothetical protein